MTSHDSRSVAGTTRPNSTRNQPINTKPPRVLVAGWFSFDGTGATAGDLLAKDLICEWIDCAGLKYDVALAAPFHGGVDWSTVDPSEYSHVVFVCGPFYKSNLLQRFHDCRLIGVNLSMTERVEYWNPFDLLLERDSSARSHPDITFLSRGSVVPVVGLTLGDAVGTPDVIENYRRANTTIQQFVSTQSVSAVTIDTRLDVSNRSGLRTAAEIESLIARMDVVFTTRLHGLVLALKNGVPAIAIDPAPDGGKIRRQAETIGWPLVFNAQNVTNAQLRQAFAYCLTAAARRDAAECRKRAEHAVERVRDTFTTAMTQPLVDDTWGDRRKRGGWLVFEGQTPPTISMMNRFVLRLKQARRAFLEKRGRFSTKTIRKSEVL